MSEAPRGDTRRTVVLIGVAVLAIAVAIAAVVLNRRSNPDDGGKRPTVKVNIVTWPGYGPIFLAKEKGFFKEEGVEVDCQIQENTQARHAALVAGQIDLVGITLESVILANANDVPMQVVGVTDISNGSDGIVAVPEIKTVADLKGKKVAFPEGQPSHLFLLYHLDKAGLTIKDVEPVYTDDAGKAGEIFAAGQVDAAVTWEPWLSKASEGKRGGHVVVTSKGVKDILIGILAADRNKVTGSEDKLRRFFRGWYRGLEYARAHPEESNAIMAKGFGLPTQEFTDILAGLRFYEKGEAKVLLGADGEPAGFGDIVKYEESLWRKAGVIKKPVEPETVYTGRILTGVK